MRSVRAARGRERQCARVFDHSRVPMVIVDNDRRYVGANSAARLAFRLSLDELQRRRIDDLTPNHMLDNMSARWADLMGNGAVAGPYDVGFPDGSRLTIVYSALANVLPGRHVIAFAPAAWGTDELQPPADAVQAPLGGKLTPREREVMSLIAAGAGLREVAEELTIAPATAKSHARNALRKLRARTRAHAVALAIRAGLIELPPAEAQDDSSD